MTKDPYKIIKRPMLTEKATIVRDEENTYVFEVALDANKVDIIGAVEKLFKVRVTSVNTVIQPGKVKRVKFKAGTTRKIKKAYVKLAEGDGIDFYQGV